MDTDDENYRRECEARYWLNNGYSDAKNVSELMKRIKKQRGQEAANELKAEMRRQWRLNNE